MPTDKERASRVLQEMPEDSTFDEILREIAFARMLERGIADSGAGRTISSAEMKRRIRAWRKSAGH